MHHNWYAGFGLTCTALICIYREVCLDMSQVMLKPRLIWIQFGCTIGWLEFIELGFREVWVWLGVKVQSLKFGLSSWLIIVSWVCGLFVGLECVTCFNNRESDGVFNVKIMLFC